MGIGNNLKELMNRGNVSLTEISERLSMENDYLESIINGDTTPPVSVLLKIASLLSTDISEIIYGIKSYDKKVVMTPHDKRVKISRKSGYSYENLAPYYHGRSFEPLMIEVKKRKAEEIEISTHKGEEFHFVLDGEVEITIDNVKYSMSTGDSIYFDSELPHFINSITEISKLITVVCNKESMENQIKGKKMKDIIHAAKLLKKKNVALICPDSSSLSALNRAIEENIIDKIFLIGNSSKIENTYQESLIFKDRYIYKNTDLVDDQNQFELNCAKIGAELIKENKADIFMKGKINTANFMKGVLAKEFGLIKNGRLSLISIFEIPNVNRLIFLTDPAINPSLFSMNSLESSIDIIKNAIDAARSMGVYKPCIALLDANEIPTSKIPSTLLEKELSEMNWENAYVYGPLSYDLALYEDAVVKKGMSNNKVAGKADILVVPHIEGGNFIYKSWVLTMGAEVANLVAGAKCPIVLTSRSDSEMTKFLTICAASIYGSYVRDNRN